MSRSGSTSGSETYELDELDVFGARVESSALDTTSTSDDDGDRPVSRVTSFSSREGGASRVSPRPIALVVISNPFINNVISRQLNISSVSLLLTLGCQYTYTCQLPGEAAHSAFQLRFTSPGHLPTANDEIYADANAFLLLYHDEPSLNTLLGHNHLRSLVSNHPVFIVRVRPTVARDIPEADEEKLMRSFFAASYFAVKESDSFPVADVGFAKVFSSIKATALNSLVPFGASMRFLGSRRVVFYENDDLSSDEHANGGESVENVRRLMRTP